MSTINEYRAALHRLISNKPLNLSKGSSINKDTVALEAGRKRGSIKKSRLEHAQLIAEIEAAALTQKASSQESANQLIDRQKRLKNSAQQERDHFKKAYELALTKIVSLEYENHFLKQQINELKNTATLGNNVIGLIRS